MPVTSRKEASREVPHLLPASRNPGEGLASNLHLPLPTEGPDVLLCEGEGQA